MPTATTKEKVRALVAAQLGSASYFLKIDGIRGESQDRQHRDEIELQSFAWGNSSAEPQGGASGTASGKVTFQDFQFATLASKAGPQLMLHCATGKHIPRAIMTGRKEAGREPQEYLKITLEDVLVGSYVSSGSSGDGGAPMDTASLRFGKIEVEYREFKANGQIGNTVKASFDIAKNTGS
jgi:type VI secretion system secreted protein Hcp